jgi:siroheme synthase-like protein
MSSYPIFLQIKHFKCLVIGGGRVATTKVKGLLAAGAKPTVIAPEVSENLKMCINENNLEWIPRVYRQGDTSGFQLIIAATNNVDINKAIRIEAQTANLLINDVSGPKDSNFHIPATVRQSLLEVAIGTSGEIPYLSHRMKDYFLQKLNPDIDMLLREMQRCRISIITEAANDDSLKKKLMEEKLHPLVENFLAVFLK